MTRQCATLLLLAGILGGISRAQDIEARLAGASSSQGFTVKSNAGTPLFTVRADGKLGLGILNPDAMLHVNGDIKISSGTPAAGKVLTSDANGMGSWQPLPTGVTGSGGANRCAFWDGNASLSSNQNFVFDPSQNRLAVGTSSPEFKLTLDADGGIIAKGTSGSGATLTTSGSGTRMIWYPNKQAFRAGGVAGTEWDDANIGTASVAFGKSTKADGAYATAMGNQSWASGDYSIGAGHIAWATENGSMAFGTSVVASGFYSSVMGAFSESRGQASMALGYSVSATGDFSTAIGSAVNTNYKTGAFVIGDHSSNTDLSAGSNNVFKARFAGGYDLLTNAGMSIGVTLAANGNSWASISDSTKKTNHHTVDGEKVLASFPTLRLGSWNYTADNDPAHRHYGPMAQEWFAAFGRDGVGIVGNDTTLGSSDVDGVLAIAIKALERRTSELREKTDALQALSATLRKQTAEIELLHAKIDRLQASAAEAEGLRKATASVSVMQERMASLEALFEKRLGSASAQQASLPRDNR